MSGVELDILVQEADEVNVEEVLDFIEEHKNRKFVLIYSALKDEMTRLNFLTSFLKKNSGEFLGCGVPGFYTNTGYYSDHIAVCVFSGDLEVEIHQTPIEHENPQETVDRINERINEHELLLVHSADTIDDNYRVETILKQVQEKTQGMQIIGGVSSPPQFIATKKGIFNNTLAFALFKRIDYSLEMDCGFELDEKSTYEFKLTKVYGNKIYEINGKNAAQEYQKIQHVRDYLFNQLVEMTNKQDIVEMPGYFQKANEILFDAWEKIAKDFLGAKLEQGFMNMFLVTHINKDKIRVNNLWPEGAILKRTKTTPEKQLEVYDRLCEKHSEGEAMILIDCAMRLFYYNYQTDEAYNRLKKIKYPLIATQVYGEIGNYTPYHPKENIIHNATVKALIFK